MRRSAIIGTVRVAIAGAGIGGLTAALAAQRAGHQVTLVEQATRLGEVGAGLQLSPNGRRVLHHLGLAEPLAAVAVHPHRVVLRRWDDDRELLSNPLGDMPERLGLPYANIYRPDLVDVLTGALARTTAEMRLGSRVVGVEPAVRGQGNPHAVLQLGDGTEVAADVVVGADGTNSVVRTAALGPHPARPSGLVAYRALVPRAAVAHLPLEVTNRLGPDRHLVSYVVGRGERFMNLVCVVPEPGPSDESWTARGSVAELRAHFAGWAPVVGELLAQVQEPVYRWALFDRTPLDYWSNGYVTLLGDACHPMLPFMAQGACQAIEDAAVLVRCLDGVDPGGGVAGALRRYEAARKPRTAEIQSRSWGNATTYHLPDGPAQQLRDEQYARAMAAGAGATAMDWVYGHDVTTEPLPSS